MAGSVQQYGSCLFYNSGSLTTISDTLTFQVPDTLTPADTLTTSRHIDSVDTSTSRHFDGDLQKVSKQEEGVSD